MFCRNCGSVVGEGFMSCHNCGQNPNTGSNYCPECGHFCIPGDVKCIQCGTSLTGQPIPQPAAQQQSGFVAGASKGYAEPEKPLGAKIGPKFLPSDKKYCRNCGLVISALSTNCEFCDSPVGSNYCHKCGSGTTSMDTVCSVCAAPLTMAQNVGRISSPQPPRGNVGYNNSGANYNANGYMNGNVPVGIPNNMNMGGYEQKQWSTALILSLIGLLGIGGLHRFYTGRIGSGVLQLLSFLCFVGYVWQIIDIIMILVDSFKDDNGQPLKK